MDKSQPQPRMATKQQYNDRKTPTRRSDQFLETAWRPRGHGVLSMHQVPTYQWTTLGQHTSGRSYSSRVTLNVKSNVGARQDGCKPETAQEEREWKQSPKLCINMQKYEVSDYITGGIVVKNYAPMIVEPEWNGPDDVSYAFNSLFLSTFRLSWAFQEL